MVDCLLTLFTFLLTIGLIPLLTTWFLGLRIINNIYIKLLSVYYTDYEFIKYKTIRTLLDTHRNQGILNVLLCISGEPQPHLVKRHVEEVVRRKNKQGDLVFPRLRQCLTTKFGLYAWKAGKFNVEQHIVIATEKYRGRAISDNNVQDYISHIVSKYLPIGVSPWQLILVPTTENKHYILLKMHHVLLREGLNIADLLPLIPPARQAADSPVRHSPLEKVFRAPESIPHLRDRLTEEFTNKWNELISNYDPLERPEILKCGPGFYEFQVILFITLASTLKEYRRGRSAIRPDLISKARYLFSTLKRECRKRQVTPSMFVRSIFVTLDPRNLIVASCKFYWYMSVTLTLKTPVFIYHEVMSLFNCITLGYTTYPNTFVAVIYNYVPLFFYASKEVYQCLKLLVQAPHTLLQEIFFDSETIQTVTLCGRKVVAWSDPVKTDTIKDLANKLGVTETEVVLTAASAGICRYLVHSNSEEKPSTLPITAINFNSSFVFSSGTNVRPSDSISGVLCLTLPIPGTEEEAVMVENLQRVQEMFEEALEKQSLLTLFSLAEIKYGVLTKLFPETFLSVLLKYLSRKYPVSFTEITCRHPNVKQCTLWGDDVISAIFWRPPQANICISLCLNEYDDHVRLGVMCDAQLGPHHPALAKAFPEHICRLAAIANLYYQEPQETTSRR